MLPFHEILYFGKGQIGKDQLMSEYLFEVLNFPKDHRKILQISALEFKKWSNHEICNDFDTNNVQII